MQTGGDAWEKSPTFCAAPKTLMLEERAGCGAVSDETLRDLAEFGVQRGARCVDGGLCEFGAGGPQAMQCAWGRAAFRAGDRYAG